MHEVVLKKAAPEERLRWHKPEVKRLVINVDTRSDPSQFRKFGSGDDLEIKGQGQFVDL